MKKLRLKKDFQFDFVEPEEGLGENVSGLKFGNRLRLSVSKPRARVRGSDFFKVQARAAENRKLFFRRDEMIN